MDRHEVKRWVEQVTGGNCSEAGRRLGCSPQLVSCWARGERRVTKEWEDRMRDIAQTELRRLAGEYRKRKEVLEHLTKPEDVSS